MQVLPGADLNGLVCSWFAWASPAVNASNFSLKAKSLGLFVTLESHQGRHQLETSLQMERSTLDPAPNLNFHVAGAS
jgi:hypothetical protein